ncbi:MAG: competence/damage-inducible protein A [Candidatus Puniceispirillaceae bacterium]
MATQTAAILVIGDEILSGRTKDKNIGWLAEQLNEIGIDLIEARVIADVESVIIRHVRELSESYDYLFTSGGIGPTHDDITTASIAKAFGKAVIRHEEAERRLLAHYKDTDIEFNEARQKMADIPEDAALIDNPASAAPGFILENVYVMAGVPSILQSMFEGLKDKLEGGPKRTRITVQCAIGEGTIATIMQEVSNHFEGLSVGSYPWFKPGQFGTAVVITSKDKTDCYEAATMMADKVRSAGHDAQILAEGQDS